MAAMPLGLSALATALMAWVNATHPELPIPEDMTFARGDMPVGVSAMYDNRNDTVLLPDEFWEHINTPMAAVILLHEMVHAMQDEAGRLDGVLPNDINARQANEAEAYDIMFEYMEVIGLEELVPVLRADPAVQAASGTGVAGLIMQRNTYRY